MREQRPGGGGGRARILAAPVLQIEAGPASPAGEEEDLVDEGIYEREAWRPFSEE